MTIAVVKAFPSLNFKAMLTYVQNKNGLWNVFNSVVALNKLIFKKRKKFIFNKG